MRRLWHDSTIALCNTQANRLWSSVPACYSEQGGLGNNWAHLVLCLQVPALVVLLLQVLQVEVLLLLHVLQSLLLHLHVASSFERDRSYEYYKAFQKQHKQHKLVADDEASLPGRWQDEHVRVPKTELPCRDISRVCLRKPRGICG